MQENLNDIKNQLNQVKLALDADKNLLDKYKVSYTKLEQKIKDALIQTNSPIRIGVVGEFSSGKSLLLSGLLGRADLLPTSEIPTTGNITELVLFSSEEKETSISSRVVSFMSRDRIKQLCKAFHDELHKELVNARLSDLERTGQSLLNRLDDGLASIQTELEAWGSALWRQVNAGPIRSIIKEYITFVRAAIAGVGLYDQKISIDAHMMDTLLRIDGQESQNIVTFEHIPKPKENILNAHHINLAALPSFKSIIQKIEIDVQVPKHVWDLSDLTQVGRIALVDFPGVGASDSKVRDAFLCRSEIKDMQTFLLLLNATRPGSGGAGDLYSMMKGDYQGDLDQAIIVGVARVNQMTFNSRVNYDTYRESEVRNKQDEYRKLMESALSFVGGDISRLCFLMQNCSFNPLMQLGCTKESLGINDDLFHRLEEYQEKTDSFWDYWGGLAQEVHQEEPNSPITRLLEAHPYEGGGGVLELRRVLINHVEHHGLRALQTKLDGELYSISKSVKDIIELYNQNHEQTETANPDMKRLLTDLGAHYQSVKHNLEKEPIRFLSQDGEKTLIEELSIDICQKIYEDAGFLGLINAVNSTTLKLPNKNEDKSSAIANRLFKNRKNNNSTHIQSYKDLGELYDRIINHINLGLNKKIEKAIESDLEMLSINENLAILKNKINLCINGNKTDEIIVDLRGLKDDILKIMDLENIFETNSDEYSQAFPYSRDRNICWDIENNKNYYDEDDSYPEKKFHFINVALIRQNIIDAMIYSIKKTIKKAESKYLSIQLLNLSDLIDAYTDDQYVNTIISALKINDKQNNSVQLSLQKIKIGVN